MAEKLATCKQDREDQDLDAIQAFLWSFPKHHYKAGLGKSQERWKKYCGCVGKQKKNSLPKPGSNNPCVSDLRDQTRSPWFSSHVCCHLWNHCSLILRILNTYPLWGFARLAVIYGKQFKHSKVLHLLCCMWDFWGRASEDMFRAYPGLLATFFLDLNTSIKLAQF